MRAACCSTSYEPPHAEHVLSFHALTVSSLMANTGEVMIGVRCPHSGAAHGPCFAQNVYATSGPSYR